MLLLGLILLAGGIAVLVRFRSELVALAKDLRALWVGLRVAGVGQALSELRGQFRDWLADLHPRHWYPPDWLRQRSRGGQDRPGTSRDAPPPGWAAPPSVQQRAPLAGPLPRRRRHPDRSVPPASPETVTGSASPPDPPRSPRRGAPEEPQPPRPGPSPRNTPHPRRNR